MFALLLAPLKGALIVGLSSFSLAATPAPQSASCRCDECPPCCCCGSCERCDGCEGCGDCRAACPGR